MSLWQVLFWRTSWQTLQVSSSARTGSWQRQLLFGLRMIHPYANHQTFLGKDMPALPRKGGPHRAELGQDQANRGCTNYLQGFASLVCITCGFTKTKCHGAASFPRLFNTNQKTWVARDRGVPLKTQDERFAESVGWMNLGEASQVVHRGGALVRSGYETTSSQAEGLKQEPSSRTDDDLEQD